MSASIQGALALADSSASTFNFHTHAVRVIMRDGEPWFVCTDVAEALGYRDAHNAARCLTDRQKGTHNLSTPSGDQKATIINESGLYRLVLRSHKPEAVAFSDWVTGEVLPAIRKTGKYSVEPAPVAAPRIPPAIYRGVVVYAQLEMSVSILGKRMSVHVPVPPEILPYREGDLLTLQYPPGTVITNGVNGVPVRIVDRKSL